MNPEEIFQVSQGLTLSAVGNSNKCHCLWRNILPVACGTAVWLVLGARCQRGRFSAVIRFCRRARMIPSRNSLIVINHFWNGKGFICAAASGGTAIHAAGWWHLAPFWGRTPVTVTLKINWTNKKKSWRKDWDFYPTGTLSEVNDIPQKLQWH